MILWRGEGITRLQATGGTRRGTRLQSMNEPVTKSRPQIDVEEFERYLRETTKAPLSQEDDPLAELARLVSNNRDPYDEVFLRGGEGASGRGSVDSRRAVVDFAAIEAGLRGSLPGHEGDEGQAASPYPQEANAGGNQGYYDPQGAALSGGRHDRHHRRRHCASLQRPARA